MPATLSTEETRDVLLDHLNRIQSLPTFEEPTPEMYSAYAQVLGLARSQYYETNRGKRLISIDLNMTVSEFEALFVGKSVLDIGCGEGILSRELANLKRTQVTALDNDPEMLDHIKESRNLRAVLGSGFNIAEVVGDEKFDVVISSYSTYSWATNAEEKYASIMSPLGSCSVEGKAIFVPILADPEAKERNRRLVASAVAPAVGETAMYGSLESVEAVRMGVCVSDWLEALALDTLLDEEKRGAIACSFVSSRDNAKNIPLIRGETFGIVPRLQHYSAIIDVMETS